MATLKRLARTKTLWVAVAGISTAIGAYVGGELSGVEAVKSVFFGLAAITGRDALAKAR
ncbi:MAG: hypothetical protein U0990_09380 [Candidatus Nanopelagicales bacterium]|nr:hypothetical protein [Candidatus Nanopelagicales bacterium]